MWPRWIEIAHADYFMPWWFLSVSLYMQSGLTFGSLPYTTLTLSIPASTRPDNGTYTCTASNAVARTSDSSTVTVLGKIPGRYLLKYLGVLKDGLLSGSGEIPRVLKDGLLSGSVGCDVAMLCRMHVTQNDLYHLSDAPWISYPCLALGQCHHKTTLCHDVQ